MEVHCFPASVAICTLRLREVKQAPFKAWTVSVRIALNSNAKESSFLSVLLLQMRLRSTCLLGRGELCSKLCGCILWRNNNIYNICYI